MPFVVGEQPYDRAVRQVVLGGDPVGQFLQQRGGVDVRPPSRAPGRRGPGPGATVGVTG
ncbi:hypothetical protein [Streptomyces sp. NPDC057496]|uniref:hypothetical protein n=1 Tax=Streptomyces sp. NPDC057496 TaxID=3346149 RepID=UPI0036809FAF